MQQKKLVKAIAMLAAGTTLSLGAVGPVSADVMYNSLNLNANAKGVDGWVMDGSSVIPWLGTPDGGLPFGFTEEQHPLNWAVMINSPGETMEISAVDAANRFNGAAVDLDTANGAWGAWQVDPQNPTFTRGWAHNTDFGLIKSAVDTTVRIEVSKVNAADNISNYGITVFEGMNTGGASHHAPWNIGYISGVNETPAKVDNPFGGTGTTYLIHGDRSYVEFFAQANHVYSIALGGNDIGGDVFGTPFGYKVNISAVPVPAAAWLFGSGLLGLVGIHRRKPKEA